MVQSTKVVLVSGLMLHDPDAENPVLPELPG
jgi:hypothetical protein